MHQESVSTRSIYLASTVAALGGLLFGFDTAVINGAIVFLKRQFALNVAQTEIAASSILVGCAVGASIAGPLSDHFGRKKLLISAAALFSISSVGAAIPANLWQFVAARLAGGLAIGIASMLSPLYISEISPARLRGRLITLNQLALVSGILLAFFVNYLLSALGPQSWRWMFGSAAIPSLLFLLALLPVPESPRWLVKQGRPEQASLVLKGFMTSSEAIDELERISSAVQEESPSLRASSLRKPLVIGIGLAIFQQITGINTILYYGSLIFLEQMPKQTDKSALLVNVIVGAVNLAGTLVALALIDRIGRRPLLIATFFGMGASLFFLDVNMYFHGSSLLSLACVLAYVALFAVGVGPAVWIVMAEIFPTTVRGRAMSLATIVLWLACLLITSTFLSLVNALSVSGAFLLYLGLSLIASIFVLLTVPETKGRTLEEIEHFWKQKS